MIKIGNFYQKYVIIFRKWSGIMTQKIRTYKKDFDYSYTLGSFLTIELLNYQSDKVSKVILHTKAKESEGISKIISLCKKNSIPYEYNDKLIEKLSPKENCFAIGIFQKYQPELDKNDNHVVLVNPSDSGNLGTIIRTSIGFGVKNLAIIRPAVDIYDPKTVRASMGALFNINFSYFNDFSEYQKHFPKHHCYPFMLNGKLRIQEVDIPHKPFALIFGNEGKGLDSSFSNVGTSVVIPHLKTIDSLNVSIAVGIAIYEFTKHKF